MEAAANLNPKKRAFCEAYSVTRNGAKAAKEAGYAEKNARIQAFQLLQEPAVKAYIEYLEAEKLAEANISKADLLLELKKVAFSNIGDYVNYSNPKRQDVENPDFDPDQEESEENRKTVERWVGGLAVTDFDDLSKDQLAAISEISDSPKFGFKFKLHSKLDAIGKLAELLGHKAPEKKEITVTEGNLEKTSYSLKKRPAVPGKEKSDQQSQPD